MIINKQWAFPIPPPVETLGFDPIVSGRKFGGLGGIVLCQAWELRAGKSAACPTPSDGYQEGAGEQWKGTMMAKRPAVPKTRGILADTRVPWHRLSPATRYRGDKTSIGLTAGRRASSKLLQREIRPHGGARRACPSKAKPARFPREGGRGGLGQHPGFGRRCHHHPPPPAARDGPAGCLPPRASASPSTGGMGCRDTGRSARQRLPVPPAAVGFLGETDPLRKRGGGSPPPNLPWDPRSERCPSTRACQEVRHRVGLWESPWPPGLRCHPWPSKTGTPNQRDEADPGLAPVLLPSTGGTGVAGGLETPWGVPGLICWPARFINICEEGRT